MTTVRAMSHLPLVRIDEPRVEIGGGALVALPFDEYDELVRGSFTDERRRYEATAPVFFVTEGDDAEDLLARHVASAARVRDALALADPSSAIPDPSLSLMMVDVPGEEGSTQTLQGDADQELLFLGHLETATISSNAIARAAQLLELVDACDGELRAALDVLHSAADLSLAPVEQLTLCTIALEALVLPELTTGLKQTFASRLARLVGGDDTEALARELYESRSEAVHGEDEVEVAPGVAQSLLARAVVALVQRTRDGSTLEEIRTRLDAGPSSEGARASEAAAPPLSPRILYAVRQGSPPSSSTHTLSGQGPSIDDPEIAEGELVLFAPLAGLEIDAPRVELIDVGFPLTWIWPSQVGSLEDPDIRRDWIAQVTHGTPPMACLALTTQPGRRYLRNSEVDVALVPLRRRVDTAVTAMRLAGLRGFHDPDLLGIYARDGNGGRYRRPAVYRQTVLAQLGRTPTRPEGEAVDDLAALWALLLVYDADRRHPDIDHALALFRRAHIALGLSLATRLELLFASLEAAAGRLPRDGVHGLERLAELTGGRDANAFEWYAANGREVRNALAHGEWAPSEEDPQSRAALVYLQDLLGELLPALIMAWRRRKKAGPAKTLADALAEPQPELDWRSSAAAGEAAERELQAARDQRYARLDTSVMIDRAAQALVGGELEEARSWFAAARSRGDVYGDYGLARMALQAGDAEAARPLFIRAVEGGIAGALTPLGKIERDRGDLEAGRAYLRRALELGDPDAIISLGVLERAAGNFDAARDLYERASDAGDLRATYNLGLLEDKLGNKEAALGWFTLSAEAGDVNAMGWAGDLEAEIGERETARAWWRQSAEHGDANSAARLGEEALADGDRAQARAWLQQAAAAGSAQAAQRLAQLDL
jgi:TPR repeat protein